MGRKAVNRKFNNTQILEIRTKYRDGILQREVAALLGVSPSDISGIVTGLYYKDAPWPPSLLSGKDCRSLPVFPGYRFDSDGNAYSFKNNKRYGHKIKLHPNSKGYLTVPLININGLQCRKRINRIICTLFHGLPPTPKHQARHLNGIKTDNRTVNLAWGTQGENELDKIKHGTKPVGEKVGSSKLTESMIKEIRASKQSSRQLAKKYGVSQPTIIYAINRRNWKHVP